MFHVNNMGQKETMLPVIQPIQRRQGAVRDVVKERAICTGPYTTVCPLTVQPLIPCSEPAQAVAFYQKCLPQGSQFCYYHPWTCKSQIC